MADSKWEKVDQYAYTATMRLRVPGGWLYRIVIIGNRDTDSPMTFVPYAAEPEDT